MKSKAAKPMANGGPPKTKAKPERKRPKPVKSEEDGEAAKPAKIAKVVPKANKKEKEQPVEEKENAQPSNGSKLSQINKAVFVVFKKLQNGPLSQKMINSLIVLLRDDTNIPQRTATCCYVLKRLIRSTGADDIKAVALAASYMHCILSSVPGIDALDVLETLKKDLAVGSQQRGKEDALAAVGQLVTAFCILQTPQFAAQAKPKLVASVYQILVAQLKGREYLVSMCADILAESFKQLPAEVFEEQVWPLLQPQLNLPLSGLKVNTCDLLFSVHLTYPSILARGQLLSSLWPKAPQYAQLFELYISGSTIHSDGVYARLARFIVGGGKELLAAWQQFVDAKQPLKLAAAKACAIQVIGHILLNFKAKEEQAVVDLFSPTTVQFLLQELANVKGDRSEVSKPSQKELRAICYKFEGSLILSFEKQLQTEQAKLQLLLKLLGERLQLDLGISLPRFSQQLIGTLGVQGLQQLYDFYSKQLSGLGEEDKPHGEHCLNQMQFILHHAQLEKEGKWRQKQLKLLLLAGLFHLDSSQEACDPKEASLFSRQCSARCEEIFLGSLLHKCSGLPALCQLLQKHVGFLSKQLAKPEGEGRLLRPRNEAARKAWKKVEKLLAHPSEESDVVAQTFEALILFVALAMFTKSPLPVAVLEDLIICRKNALEKGKKAADELKWQDVLTDALLQLLLQTGHFWREFVSLVAGALIPHLEPSNLEQVLEVLNMNRNPLSKKEEGEESDEEEEEEQDPDDSSDDSDEEDDEDEEDEDGDEEDNEESRLAQIRESVRQALVDDDNVADDASSVDWNDVDEEQGQRLNAALERSFQLFRPKSSKAQAKQGPTKSERIDNTSLLHFRIRALDLLEIFATKKPTQAVILDVLLCAFQVYRHSSGDTKLQSLREASLKLLKKLLTKNIEFEGEGKGQDKAPILEAIEQLMSTGEEEPAEQEPEKQQQANRRAKGEVTVWRDKCFAYLVSQGSAGDKSPKQSAVWSLLVEFLELWVANRRSRLSLASFEALFQAGQWQGVAPLAVVLASHLDVAKTRSFRRAQILKLLGEQFRRLESALKDPSASDSKEFENQLARYVEQLAAEQESSPKELKLLQKILAQGGKKRTQLLEKVKTLAKKPKQKVSKRKAEEDDAEEESEEEV
ncbi:hypothetical protein KR009_008581, partial [Drosophila setifemur]